MPEELLLSKQAWVREGWWDGGVGCGNRAADLGDCWTALTHQIRRHCRHRCPDWLTAGCGLNTLHSFPIFCLFMFMLYSWILELPVNRSVNNPTPACNSTSPLSTEFVTALSHVAAPFPKPEQGLGSCARDAGKTGSHTARQWAGKVLVGHQERELSVGGAERKSSGITSTETLTMFFCCCCSS